MPSLIIYQIFHDQLSYKHVCEGEFIVPLCVNPDFQPGQKAEVVKSISYTTNQLSESRAFYYALNNPNPPEFIGFTTHWHNLKFTLGNYYLPGADIIYFPKDCMRAEDFSPELVAQAFRDKKTKAIAFFPEQNFLFRADRQHKRMKDILLSWLSKEHKVTAGGLKTIEKIQYRKFVPLCNSFILRWDEFKKYFEFMDDFVRYIDREYGINRFNLGVPVAKRHIGREWGLFVERVMGLYLVYNYGYDFNVVFISKDKEIHRLNGTPFPVLYRMRLKALKKIYDLKHKSNPRVKKRILELAKNSQGWF
jgi:hypothetical protein